MYSPDKKKLNVEVTGQGREVTKKLSDKVANIFNCDTYIDFSAEVMSSLYKTFQDLKAKTSKSSKDDQTK